MHQYLERFVSSPKAGVGPCSGLLKAPEGRGKLRGPILSRSIQQCNGSLSIWRKAWTRGIFVGLQIDLVDQIARENIQVGYRFWPAGIRWNQKVLHLGRSISVDERSGATSPPKCFLWSWLSISVYLIIVVLPRRTWRTSTHGCRTSSKSLLQGYILPVLIVLSLHCRTEL